MAITPSDINPIENVYSYIYTIVNGLVIKYSSIADEKETFENRKYFDEYYDALMKTDFFMLHKYTPEEYNAVGIMDPHIYNEYMKNPSTVPNEYQELLLENKRNAIISSYEEPNDYYRELAGLPPLNMVGAQDVTHVINQSFRVVADSDLTLETDPFQKLVRLSAARKIMNSKQIYVDDYIYIKSISIQKTATSNVRSFEIIDDDIEYDTNLPQLKYSDVESIKYGLGMDDFIYVGDFIFIELAHIQKTTSVVRESFLVVSDDTPDYDTSTMIKLSEACMNIKNISVGAYMLQGDFIYGTMEIETTYGISRKIPVHKLTSYYKSTQYINILESMGYISSQLELHPTHTYLKYVGSMNIPVHKARKAKNFELLYLPSCGRDIITSQFAILYSGCRDYFVNTVYNYYYKGIYDMYDNFIALSICSMTIAQLIARTGEAAINRDFYDERMVQMLYESYRIPYCSTLNYYTQRRLMKNLNMLIQNKAENKVLYDIAYLLGYHEISIYKYYLVKERKYDSDGNLVYKDTTKTSLVLNENNEMIEKDIIVNDLEEMYDVYFQKVDLNETNYEAAISNKSNRVAYETITEADPLWWDDDDTWDEVYGDPTKFTEITEPEIYHKHYNYTETKYLGISMSYKMSEILYDNIVLLRMIFDMKDELSDIHVTFPKLTGGLQVTVFDCVVFLCALICKRYNLTGEIQTKVSSVLNIIGYLTIDADGYIPCDTVAFNFEKVRNLEVFNEIMKNPRKYLKPDEVSTFEGYFKWVTLPQTTEKEKVQIFNEMYQNIKSLGYFVGRKMSESDNYKEYSAWRDLYNALFIQKEAREMFELGTTGEIAKTYDEYLEVMNPALYQIVTDADETMLYSHIDHVISRLEKVVDDLSTLYIVNDSTSSVHGYLMKLVKFFKSYTTDLIDLSTQYIFDLKPDNLFKLVEHYKIHKVSLLPEVYHTIYSDVAKVIAYMRKYETVKYDEYIMMTKTSEAFDYHVINNITQSTCKSGICPHICKNDRNSCDGYHFSNGKWVECEEYYLPDIKELSSVIHEFTSTLNMLRENNNTTSEMSKTISNTIHCAKSILIYIEGLNSVELNNTETHAEIQTMVDKLSMSYLEVCREYASLGKIRTVTEIFDIGNITTELNRLIDPATRVMKCRNDNYPCMSYTCNFEPRISELHEVLTYLTTMLCEDKLFYDEYLKLYVRMVLNEDIYMKENVHYIATLLTNRDYNHLIINDHIRSILKIISDNDDFGYYDLMSSQATLSVIDGYTMRDDVTITSKNT